MIGNKLEQSIISVFQENLSETFSINSISKRLKKSYPHINKKSNFLLKEGVLGKIIIGKSYQCYLNLNNDKARVFVVMNEINKRDAFIQQNKEMQNVMDELNQIVKRYKIFTAIISKNNIILVLEDTALKEQILLTSFLTKDYNMVFFDKTAFQRYFLSEPDFQKYHIIAANAENFVSIISEISEQLLFRNLMATQHKSDKMCNIINNTTNNPVIDPTDEKE